jgi:hypothetical protein
MKLKNEQAWLPAQSVRRTAVAADRGNSGLHIIIHRSAGESSISSAQNELLNLWSITHAIQETHTITIPEIARALRPETTAR